MMGFIAIDGGGSKTELVLFDKIGNVFLRVITSCTNPNDIGIDAAYQTLENVIEKAIEKAKTLELDLKCIMLGIAGIEFGDTARIIKKRLQEKFNFNNIVVEGDLASVQELTLKDKANGAVIISGTGFNMSFKVNGKFENVGGWGYVADNYLSGFDLGKDALVACSKAIDGIGEDTCLVDMLEDYYCGNSLWYSMDEIYKGGIKEIASLSRFVIEGYLSNDSVCEKIVDTRVQCLANIIKKKAPVPVDIYLCGGIFENNLCIVDKLEQWLDYKYPLHISKKRIIYGVVSLAIKYSKIQVDERFDGIFENSYKELVR